MSKQETRLMLFGLILILPMIATITFVYVIGPLAFLLALPIIIPGLATKVNRIGYWFFLNEDRSIPSGSEYTIGEKC